MTSLRPSDARPSLPYALSCQRGYDSSLDCDNGLHCLVIHQHPPLRPFHPLSLCLPTAAPYRCILALSFSAPLRTFAAFRFCCTPPDHRHCPVISPRSSLHLSTLCYDFCAHMPAPPQRSIPFSVTILLATNASDSCPLHGGEASPIWGYIEVTRERSSAACAVHTPAGA